MTLSSSFRASAPWLACLLGFRLLAADPAPPSDPKPSDAPPADTRPPRDDRPRGFGPGGPGGPMREKRKILKQFDTDGDKRLNKTEREAAREFLKKNPQPTGGGGPRRFGPPGGAPNGAPPNGGPPGDGFGPPPGGRPPGFDREENNEPPKPGSRVSPADVKPLAVSALYAPNTLRTLFLDFEGDDWEAELQDFHGTDVLVPATLTADGVKYPGVGVHFRGMSSYMMVRAGQKRSLNVSLDFTKKKQDLDGYTTLNLLNSHDDDTFLSAVLYSHIARQYIPAPKANFVRVVINGESWGVYVNAQQFNKDFLQENFRTGKGARWKVPGSPGANSGLDYLGDDLAEYKKHYDMKSGDDDDWRALIQLCKTLSQTPVDQLEAALAPLLDIDSTLWFLALDNALINNDGYWIRSSDYSIYREKDGKFHVIPSDINEAFRPPGGPGFGPGGPRRRGGPDLVAADKPTDGADKTPPPPGQSAGNDNPPPGNLNSADRPPADVGRPPANDQPGGPDRPPRRDFPGGPGGPGQFASVKGVELDPLVGLDDVKKPLRSRLLAIPALRERYLAHVRTIAEEWLDWSKLGPVVAQYRVLIEPEIAADTRKLTTLAAFQKTTADTPEPESTDRRRPGAMNLHAFADQRRSYLLHYSESKPATP